MKGTGLKNIILVLALCIPMHGASAYNHPDNLEKRLLALDKALEESGRFGSSRGTISSTSRDNVYCREVPAILFGRISLRPSPD